MVIFKSNILLKITEHMASVKYLCVITLASYDMLREEGYEVVVIDKGGNVVNTTPYLLALK